MNSGIFENFGVGIDIERCESFRFSGNNQDKFLNNIFTNTEKTYCLKTESPHIHFCARFAAKEAAIKALSSINIINIPLREIEISNWNSGVPEIQINGNNKDNKYPNLKLKVSLSHTDEYAIAIVIVFMLGEFQ